MPVARVYSIFSQNNFLRLDTAGGCFLKRLVNKIAGVAFGSGAADNSQNLHIFLSPVFPGIRDDNLKYFYQLNFKSKVFAGKGVVSIYDDYVVRYTGDSNYSLSAVWLNCQQLLPNLWSPAFGKFVPGYFHQHVFKARPVSLIRWNSNGFLFPYLHPFDGFIKPGDHLACTYSKLQRFTPSRCIEDGTACQRPDIVYLNGIAKLGYGCKMRTKYRVH